LFDYEQFLAKARLYFSRASEAEESSEEQAIWLVLGLEFLLRAPLARVHATLLALPEGDSILHAAGIERARGLPRSIPTKSVIDRLTKIDPNFGEDRGKDAAFLTELRNEELHSSRATFASTGYSLWMPKFLGVVEAICAHLDLDVKSFLDGDLVQAAEAYKATADAQTQGLVKQLSMAARTLFEGLKDTEISTRAELPSPIPAAIRAACPVCNQQSAWLSLSAGRTTVPKYAEDQQEIHYKIVHVVNSLHCTVCNLTLEGTAQIIAAGIERLYIEEMSEDRYEGWEDMMTYEDAMKFIGEGEEYGNE
jgi:hypothetical protein